MFNVHCGKTEVGGRKLEAGRERTICCNLAAEVLPLQGLGVEEDGGRRTEDGGVKLEARELDTATETVKYCPFMG